ncbi:MAG: transporter substrate-binding domain-containing protein [Hyphomicrobiaceae bacterium]|nr:transporter substrate-binding domain-containing protein [Hyphomicrobiaceae bacterium]
MQARPLDDVKASGVLRVIVYEFNQPYSWTDEDGSVKGIDADIGRAIAAKLNLKADIIARIAGEEADDDLRSNIWQGPRTGGPVGDFMMHVPMERAFVARNNLVAISNAYHHEKVVLAVHPEMVDPEKQLSAFRSAKLAVQFATAAHYFIMFADEQAYKANVQPFVKFKDAAASFMARETAGLLGPRTGIEAALGDKLTSVRIVEPKFDTELRMAWSIGTAVKEDSRDTGYAIGNILREMEASGELGKIFAKYGTKRVAPPVP